MQVCYHISDEQFLSMKGHFHFSFKFLGSSSFSLYFSLRYDFGVFGVSTIFSSFHVNAPAALVTRSDVMCLAL